MQIQKPMMPKYIKGRSFVLFIKRREANTLSTSPLYVSTKTSPAGQTIQGVYDIVLKYVNEARPQ